MKQVFLSTLLCLAFVSPTLADADSDDTACTNEVTQYLNNRGINDVKSAHAAPVLSGPTPTVVGYTVWVRAEQCSKGFVVANTTTSCRIRSVYSRMGCHVPGLRYWAH